MENESMKQIKIFGLFMMLGLFSACPAQQVSTNQPGDSYKKIEVSVTTYGAQWCGFCQKHKEGMGLAVGVEKTFDFPFGKVPMVYIDIEAPDAPLPQVTYCGGVPESVIQVQYEGNPTSEPKVAYLCGSLPFGPLSPQDYQAVFGDLIEWGVADLIETPDLKMVNLFELVTTRIATQDLNLPDWGKILSK
ncbi:MAG: hypothetical protein CL678_18765 [Bdellovibrionaceae bacterium]|nr:hypothetical protein [Pseudobdellovibrionaceae bacterium]|tara:strand:+ start:9641 stop:10210 length:570 start_codon:yes stop_codon:yes gene_type:complete